MLSEGSNDIAVQYDNAEGSTLATAGIENETGSGGLQWRYPTAMLTNTAVRYFAVRSLTADSDGDGVNDCRDNCPRLSNSDHLATHHDGGGGAGDPCPNHHPHPAHA